MITLTTDAVNADFMFQKGSHNVITNTAVKHLIVN